MSGRIRTIKPELIDDEKTASLSDLEFRLFICFIVVADDYGNLRGEPTMLRGQLLWARGTPTADVVAAMDVLEEVGLIDAYIVRGQRYLHIAGWSKHQKVDKPGKPRVPSPNDPERIEERRWKTYFVRLGDDGPIRIGKTIHMATCITKLQATARAPLQVLRVVDANVEAVCQKRFKGARTEGEWFAATRELLEYIANEPFAADAPIVPVVTPGQGELVLQHPLARRGPVAGALLAPAKPPEPTAPDSAATAPITAQTVTPAHPSQPPVETTDESVVVANSRISRESFATDLRPPTTNPTTTTTDPPGLVVPVPVIPTQPQTTNPVETEAECEARLQRIARSLTDRQHGDGVDWMAEANRLRTESKGRLRTSCSPMQAEEFGRAMRSLADQHDRPASDLVTLLADHARETDAWAWMTQSSPGMGYLLRNGAEALVEAIEKALAWEAAGKPESSGPTPSGGPSNERSGPTDEEYLRSLRARRADVAEMRAPRPMSAEDTRAAAEASRVALQKLRAEQTETARVAHYARFGEIAPPLSQPAEPN